MGQQILHNIARNAGTRLVAYFGYGSLVNRATHQTDIVKAIPARLKGYRRRWRPRPDMPGFPAALLTVIEQSESHVDGLLIVEREENLVHIDAREARYDRVSLAADMLEYDDDLPVDCALYVYRAIDHLPPHRDPPRILRSYLDTVLQGFAREHGHEGLRHFLSETDDFEIGIHDDRESPVYPRATSVTPEESAFFDGLLAEHGIGTISV